MIKKINFKHNTRYLSHYPIDENIFGLSEQQREVKTHFLFTFV